MYVLTFSATGRPRSKGSHVAQPGNRVGHRGKTRVAPVQEADLDKWTGTIRNAASLALMDRVGCLECGGDHDDYPRAWPGPVLVLARFRLVRPLRLADTMDDEPATVVPDGDKLERALWDALTGLAFADDRQVIGWLGLKVYAGPLERAGVDCQVVALDEFDTKAGPGHALALLAQLSDAWG